MVSAARHTAFVVMGVCGVGKTSVSRIAAKRLGATCIEADDFHSEENIVAMKNGESLSDDLRKPWLKELSVAVEDARRNGHVLVACSALKRSYRDMITSIVGNCYFICLTGDRDLIASRLTRRADHFMPPTLLDSQIATLEMPGAGEKFALVDVAAPYEQVNDQVEKIIRTHLRRAAEPTSITTIKVPKGRTK